MFTSYNEDYMEPKSLEDLGASINYLTNLGEIPDGPWKEIHCSTAKEIVDQGRPVLIKYLGSWTTPRGSGFDEGWMFVNGDEVVTTRTWDNRVSANVRTVFGGDPSSFFFYCLASESVPNKWERLGQLKLKETSRWKRKQSQGYVRISTQAYPDRGMSINVDGEVWPSAYMGRKHGFPDGLTEVHVAILQKWYEKSAFEEFDCFSQENLTELVNHFPGSRIFRILLVVKAANATVRGNGTISELRKALRSSGLYTS